MRSKFNSDMSENNQISETTKSPKAYRFRRNKTIDYKYLISSDKDEDGNLNHLTINADKKLTELNASRKEARILRRKTMVHRSPKSETEIEPIYNMISDPLHSLPMPDIVSRTVSNLSDPVENKETKITNEKLEKPSSENSGFKSESHSSTSTYNHPNNISNKEINEKLDKSMLDNAQLENNVLMFQSVNDNLKDEEIFLKETISELKRLNRIDKKECNRLSHELKNSKNTVKRYETMITCRDELIKNHNLLYVKLPEPNPDIDLFITPTIMNGNFTQEETDNTNYEEKAELITIESAKLLNLNNESLDSKLKAFQNEIQDSRENIKNLTEKIKDERNKNELKQLSQISNAETEKDVAVNIKTTRQLNEYKLKITKLEQEKTSLNNDILRFTTKLKRYKENNDKAEDEIENIKSINRKLQRLVRSLETKVDDLNSKNASLLHRITKKKNSRKKSGETNC